jgi:hypothetical protein
LPRSFVAPDVVHPFRYAHDQGVTNRRMTIDDLFPREVRAMARV